MVEKTLKPFDLLNGSKGKELEVELKSGEIYIGKLKAFDVHLNLVLFETKLIKNDEEKEVGNILIRGDALVTIKNI
jgi:small nuclear ribonucleoprotein (snRNP)-like protein